MLKSIFDKGIFNSLNFDNAPKLCKEMESQRIDMTALEFMCAVPIIVKCLDLSKKEQMGAIAFASAIVSLNTNEEGKKCLAKPLTACGICENRNPPRKHSRIWRAQEGRICCRCRADRISKVQAA